MKANDSDCPRSIVWLICLSQGALLTLACAPQINDGLRALGLPIAAPAPLDQDILIDPEWTIG